MRYYVIALVAVLYLAFGCLTQSHAVGYYAVGKEDCRCSPLVERGIIPDTLNQLGEALILPRLGWAIERLALELRAVASQFGPKTETAAVEISDKKEPLYDIEEPPKLEKKSPADQKIQKPKKKTKDTAKKKRVRVPTRTL